MPRYLLFICLLFLGNIELASYSRIEAEENFRLGVNAFHFGYYQQALFSFEKSLSYLLDVDVEISPEAENLRNTILAWLARTYYYNGSTKQALRGWSELNTAGEASSALTALYEIINARYNFNSETTANSMSLFAFFNNDNLFLRPLNIRQSPYNGYRYLVDFTGNSLLILDINGKLIKREQGSLNLPYQQPYDILFRPQGGFIISNYANNQLIFHNQDGDVIDTSENMQELLGPQYLAAVDENSFYVSDWGHRRIAKFNFAGEKLFEFGDRRSTRFPGLSSPTGLASQENFLAVADNNSGSLYLFDHNGSYLSTPLDGVLEEPEGLLFDTQGDLLIADKNTIKRYRWSTKQLDTFYEGTQSSRFYGIAYDENSHLMLSDFVNQRVEILANDIELYTNLFVIIEKIYSENFPRVFFDVRVENRDGQAVANLTERNFTLFENEQQLTPLTVKEIRQPLHFTLIGSSRNVSEAVTALNELLQKDDSMDFILDQPSPIVYNVSQKIDLSQFEGETQTEELSSLLRLAGENLVQKSGRRIILYLVTDSKEGRFERYGLADTLQFFRNNHLLFYVVSATKASDSLNYILENTSGEKVSFQYLKQLAQDFHKLRRQSAGLYQLSADSLRTTSLKNRYITGTVMLNYGSRSGRDESGYFPPY